ncbi:hypothetical protein [Ensifer soli]|uniref:hypothetical protein n=1 Tax=Ciceribacter sp. sgz301302 TaxID=3342379 RepID=UPI0035B84F85
MPTKPKPCIIREASTPFSIRLTATEKETLVAKAGSVPLGAFVRGLVLGEGISVRAARTSPVRDRDSLGQVLGLLGRSEYTASLAAMAKAAASGSLPLEPETVSAIRAACEDIRAIRSMLLQALGIQAGALTLSTRDSFNNAAREPSA